MKIPTIDDLTLLQLTLPIKVELGGLDAFALLGSLQVLLRHPIFAKTEPAKVARAFAEGLENRIVQISPGMKELCAAGWNPEYDV